jgi:hypothetical protein
MKLKKLSVEDKGIFTKYLSFDKHELSAYAFSNIYLWKGLFDISWAIIANNLCLVFKDKIGCFLYLPPLGKQINPSALTEAFKIMDSFNKNKEVSRIENVEDKDIHLYQNFGFACRKKYPDYLCERRDLVQLKGNKFKAKRACINYFKKHYRFEYLCLALKYKDACLKLYNRWMEERKEKNPDPIYQGMLEDSRICLGVLLGNYQDLDCVGRAIKVEGEIKGFTFGYRLNKDTFCILYEVTDLAVKGLSQFIFREFCHELSNYKYINIMDDSGLENLKKVKLSYQPIRLVPAYIVKR